MIIIVTRDCFQIFSLVKFKPNNGVFTSFKDECKRVLYLMITHDKILDNLMYRVIKLDQAHHR